METKAMGTTRLIVAAWVCGMMWAGRVGWGQAAASAADEARQKEIQALVDQLSSPDQAVRAKAQGNLVGMGDEARSALQSQIRAKLAAQSAVAKIEANNVGSPRLITLDLKEVTQRAAVAELARQSGYDVVLLGEGAYRPAGSPEPPKISLSMDKQPFWSALREVCAKGDLTVFPNVGFDRRIQLSPTAPDWATPMRAPTVISGPVLVSVLTIQRTHRVGMADPENVTRTLWMHMQAWVEPKLKVLAYDSMPSVDEAVDEKGASLATAAGDLGLVGRRTRVAPGQAGICYPISVPLRAAADTGRKLARLKGSVTFLVQTTDQAKVRATFPSAGEAAGDAGEPVKFVGEATTGTVEMPVTFEFTDLPLPP